MAFDQKTSSSASHPAIQRIGRLEMALLSYSKAKATTNPVLLEELSWATRQAGNQAVAAKAVNRFPATSTKNRLRGGDPPSAAVVHVG